MLFRVSRFFTVQDIPGKNLNRWGTTLSSICGLSVCMTAIDAHTHRYLSKVWTDREQRLWHFCRLRVQKKLQKSYSWHRQCRPQARLILADRVEVDWGCTRRGFVETEKLSRQFSLTHKGKNDIGTKQTQNNRENWADIWITSFLLFVRIHDTITFFVLAAKSKLLLLTLYRADLLLF